MPLTTLDVSIIILFLTGLFALSLAYAPKAQKGLKSYFLGNRHLSWWLAGTSMVATTFAADTPLLVTELVARYGISGNWLWWNALIGGIITTFFFAKYWHRADVLTDVALTELRYGGKPAAFLRGFKALYLGLLMNAVIIAWVNVALMKLIAVFFGVSYTMQLLFVAGAMLFVAIFSAISGLLGVVMTDFVQFIFAMTGCIVLAFLVAKSPEIGGMNALLKKLPPETIAFFPDITVEDTSSSLQHFSIGIATFLAFIGVQWWASWYPGAEPGGGGYVAQRMMSAKDEKHARKAALFFQLAHYGLRPWAWIIVGLCTIILYPQLPDHEKGLGYALAMKDYLPDGLRGMLLAAFLAAYISTISTQLNWGASYLVNDLFKRFLAPDSSEKTLIVASRISTFVLMVVALFVTTMIQTLEGAFKFMIECGAGLGAVLMLRWYWWRINAWSEIVATVVPFAAFALSKWWFRLDFPYSLFFTVSITTVSWLLATFLTPAESMDVLTTFYQKVRPKGIWKPVAARVASIPQDTETIPTLFLKSLVGIAMVYAFLFAIGYFLLGNFSLFALCMLIFAGASLYLWKRL